MFKVTSPVVPPSFKIISAPSASKIISVVASSVIVEPESIEFWIDQKNRLHKRELFIKEGVDWRRVLLSP